MPEDTHVDTLGGEPQYANGLIVSGLPQVDTIYLVGSERGGDSTWRCEGG